MTALNTIFLLCLAQAQPVQPPRGVRVEASALVVQGRQAAARRKAISRALRKAVLQRAAKFRSLKPARRRLLAEFRNYVAAYRVLEERFVGQGRSGRYRVVLDVQVDGAGLRRLANRLAGRKPAAVPCVLLKIAGGAQMDQIGRSVELRLRAAGLRTNCTRASRSVTAELSCHITEQGQVAGSFGATATCRLRAARAAAMVQASALAATGNQATMQALSRAAAKVAPLFARRLEDALGCHRARRISMNGTVPTGKFLDVARAIIRMLPKGSQTRMVVSPGRLSLFVVTARCNQDLTQRITRLSLPGLSIKVSGGPAHIDLTVDAQEQLDGPSPPISTR